MAIIRWEPFRDLERIFEDGFGGIPFSQMSMDLAVDVYEKDNTVVAEMSLPGIDPDNLDISVEDDLLRVTGSREEEQETKEKQYYSKEIRRGAFERTVRLPAQVEADAAEAEYKDGVLRITLPKKSEEVVPRKKITVKK